MQHISNMMMKYPTDAHDALAWRIMKCISRNPLKEKGASNSVRFHIVSFQMIFQCSPNIFPRFFPRYFPRYLPKYLPRYFPRFFPRFFPRYFPRYFPSIGRIVPRFFHTFRPPPSKGPPGPRTFPEVHSRRCCSAPCRRKFPGRHHGVVSII